MAEATGSHPSHLRLARVLNTLICWDCGSYSTSYRKEGLNRLCDEQRSNPSKENVVRRVSCGLAPTSGHVFSRATLLRNHELRRAAKQARQEQVCPEEPEEQPSQDKAQEGFGDSWPRAVRAHSLVTSMGTPPPQPGTMAVRVTPRPQRNADSLHGNPSQGIHQGILTSDEVSALCHEVPGQEQNVANVAED